MIHLACASDRNYLPHCAAMLHSVLSLHQAKSLKIHFLHDAELDRVEVFKLAEFVVANGGDWAAYEITEQQSARFPGNRRFGRVAWYRVLLPDLVPDEARVLYLDADTIVTRSLLELWETDLAGKALGAVTNPLYPFMNEGFLRDLGLGARDYFNSGVLLMDLRQWRASGLVDRITQRATDQGLQEWPDQNALNVVLAGQWQALSPEWNAQNTLFDLAETKLPYPADVVRRARRNPAIVHFIGPYKPWHYRCKHPLRALYWHHLSRTPWRHLRVEGITARNRLLRLLPEQWGWRLEASLRKLAAEHRL